LPPHGYYLVSDSLACVWGSLKNFEFSE
jgi:hypothetical protein